MSRVSHPTAPGRVDVAVGLFLLACLYAVEWALRRLPRTRAERLVVGGRRAGRAARVGSTALVRLELESLGRQRVERPSTPR